MILEHRKSQCLKPVQADIFHMIIDIGLQGNRYKLCQMRFVPTVALVYVWCGTCAGIIADSILGAQQKPAGRLPAQSLLTAPEKPYYSLACAVTVNL